MSVSSISSMLNSKLRFTGMASGLDTDSLIKSMLAGERAKLERAGQKRQINEWKRDAFRDITASLKTFKDDNFDVLKPSSNMRSASALAAFTTAYSQLTADTVSVVSGADASIGPHTINVTQIATQAQIATGSLSEGIAGSISLTSFPLDMAGKSITMTVDGTAKSIDLGTSGTYANLAALQADIQAGANTAFGTGRVTVSLTGTNTNQLKFSTAAGSTLSLSADLDVFTSLGFAADDSKSNRISTGSSLQSIAKFFKTELAIADVNANVSFTINGKTIVVGKTYAQATMSDIISAVNRSNAGVEMKYSSLTDSITLKNKEYGAMHDITLTDNGAKLLESLGLIGAGAMKTLAKDATFDLDGIVGMTRSSNAFTIEGNSYTLKQIGEVKLTITKNTDEMVSKIKNFVTKYNELIDKINGKFGEKYEKAYQPLTDIEKESMDSDTISKWETKAKVGLLSRDSSLSAITLAMRSALSEKVDGVGLSLSEIGISSSSYLDKGKLLIDETKLKEALNNNYSEVVSLFTKESTTTYTTTLTDGTKRATRNSENGLSQRLYDILQDNIRTTGGKGILLQKAGMPGDITEYTNILDKEMDVQELLMISLQTKITAKEDRLYARFAALEKAMNKMNSQSSWLTQQSQ